MSYFLIRERALEDRRTYIHAQCLLLSDIIDNFQKDLYKIDNILHNKVITHEQKMEMQRGDIDG